MDQNHRYGFLETPTELIAHVMSRQGERKGKGNLLNCKQIVYHGADGYTRTFHEFVRITTAIKFQK